MRARCDVLGASLFGLLVESLKWQRCPEAVSRQLAERGTALLTVGVAEWLPLADAR